MDPRQSSQCLIQCYSGSDPTQQQQSADGRSIVLSSTVSLSPASLEFREPWPNHGAIPAVPFSRPIRCAIAGAAGRLATDGRPLETPGPMSRKGVLPWRQAHASWISRAPWSTVRSKSMSGIRDWERDVFRQTVHSRIWFPRKDKKKFEGLLVLRTLTCRSTWRLVGPTVNPVWDTLTGAAELRIDPKSGCCVFMYLGPRRNFSKSRLCCFPNLDSCFSIPAFP